MDILSINDLKIETNLGCFAFEKVNKQTLIINLNLGLDAKTPAVSDELATTLDYSLLSSKLANFIGSTQFNLLETLTEKTAQFLQHEFDLAWLKLSITKVGALKNARSVTLTIERGKHG